MPTIGIRKCRASGELSIPNAAQTYLYVAKDSVSDIAPLNDSNHQMTNKLIQSKTSSDSYGRHLAELLINKCSDKCEVLGIVKPNGKLSQLTVNIDNITKDINLNDVLVVFGGTNDVNSGHCDNEILTQVTKLLKHVSNAILIIVGLPFRQDQPHLN